MPAERKENFLHLFNPWEKFSSHSSCLRRGRKVFIISMKRGGRGLLEMPPLSF